MTEKEYGRLVQRMSPKSPILRDCINAFWIGGLICTIGQLFINWYTSMGLEKTDASTAASMSLVALSALLTGLSLYDDIAKHAGAGTLVPITGFANSIAAPAVEFKTEGFILGMAAKMFTIAGTCTGLRHLSECGLRAGLLALYHFILKKLAASKRAQPIYDYAFFQSHSAYPPETTIISTALQVCTKPVVA